jgi:hypothetical protein
VYFRLDPLAIKPDKASCQEVPAAEALGRGNAICIQPPCAGFQLRSGPDVASGQVELCKLTNAKTVPPKFVALPPATPI